MTLQMTAAVLYGQKDVRIEQRPVPLPGQGEVTVAICAALTDGTDLKVFRRGYHARMIQPPALFGHEFAGVIHSLGDGVTGWNIGDRVVAANSAPCGVCRFCRKGQESLCADLLFINGAYSEYITIPERIVQKNLIRLPDETTFEAAALTEPLACVVRGVRALDLNPGMTVAIIGSGPIGLMAARLAANSGCDVLVVGRHNNQLEVARRWGSRWTLGPEIPANLPASIAKICGSAPDRVFEATGSPDLWEQALETVAPGGIINLFSGCPSGSRVSLDTNRIHYQEIRICSTFHHTPEDIRIALDHVISSRVNVSPLIDSLEPLSNLPRVLAEMDARVRTLKTVIVQDKASPSKTFHGD